MHAPSGSTPAPVHDPLERSRARLQKHPLYGAIRTPGALRAFAEHHIVCVLDSMSLLKSLQRDATCVSVPWTPVRNTQAARLIQSIVLDEETDVHPDGRVISHFEWYLEAMTEIEADTRPVRDVVGSLVRGMQLGPALRASSLPAAAVEFGLTTAALVEGPLHARAAAFFHGREEIIPELFLGVLARIEEQGLPCPSLRGYLQRHIKSDCSDRAPCVEEMLALLCQGNRVMIVEAQAAALLALHARERLWDAILRQVEVPAM
jgi:hypothetical protein